MLKSSGMILQLSEGIVLPVVVGFLSVLKISLPPCSVGEDFEMIAVEVKGMDPKCMWEIIGIYRAPAEDTLVIERPAARSVPTRNLKK